MHSLAHRSVFVIGLWIAVTAICVGAIDKSGNIAPLAKVSVSSSRPEYQLNQANDRDMNTSWSTALDHVTGQWYRLDWDEPREIRGVALIATGPWMLSVDVQVDCSGEWITVAHSGSPDHRPLVNTVFTFAPVTTRSLRLVFDGGAAFYEVEVYDDNAILSALDEEYNAPRLYVAGDLNGNMIGIFCGNSGADGFVDTPIAITGATPEGPWRASGTTAANGFFRVPVPGNAVGEIRVTGTTEGKTASRTMAVGDLSWCLTPRAKRDRISLDGQWDFTPDPPAGYPIVDREIAWSKINVPAHWEMEGFVSESGRSLYHRTFRAPRDWSGKRVKLRADAIYSYAQVWINGKRVGSHDGGATPFEIDITDAAIPGADNTIEVLVDARSKASELDNASVFAYFELAGIWQSIEVFAVEPTHIARLAVDTVLDAQNRDADLSIDVDLSNECKDPQQAHLSLQLIDPRGKRVAVDGLTATAELAPWDRKRIHLTAHVTSPEQWNAEQPHLYKLIASLDGAAPIEQQIGFRTIAIRDRAFTLNGVPVKIRGVSRLEAHPLMGRALTPEVSRLDMDLIKAANFNAVRATIFPPHTEALDRADQIGLYFENEGPTCWGNHADDLRYAATYMGIMAEYVERDRNHPCVIDWSICNESDFARVFSMSRDVVKQIDPTRICSATWGDDSLDVVCAHHPVNLQRIRDGLSLPKPLFFDETVGNFHGWQDSAFWIDLDPGMRDYWITGLPDIMRAINAGENQMGTMQFSWSDDAFLVPGKGIDIWRHEQPPIRYTVPIYKLPKRGIVGDVVWGIVDGWRRPRPEYWLSKKLYSPVQIAEAPLAIPAPGQPIMIEIANWNQFANLKEYRCRWRIGGANGEAVADVAPMSKGILSINPKRPPLAYDVLTLEFLNDRGDIVDGYRLAFQPRTIPALPNSGKPAMIREQAGYLDSANAVRLIGANVEIAYDRTSGGLLRALCDREQIMNSGPTLHILKSDAPTERYPTGLYGTRGMLEDTDPEHGFTVWRQGDVTYRTQGSQAILNWNGSYGNDFNGGYEIRMDDAGDIEIAYRFTYNGRGMTAREIGLEFDLPLDFDHLKWDRSAEYSYYPEDHIGRPIGSAVAHPKVAQTIPPGPRPYGLDDHAWGCNDFRSAKRGIYTAALTNAVGQGIMVYGGGVQTIRATVGVHDISLMVLNYYGGSGTTYWGGYHYGPGREVKTGEVLQGVIRLKMMGGNG